MYNIHVLVIGLGISGKSSAKFLLNQGAIVYAYDKNDSVVNSDEILAIQKLGIILVKADFDISLCSLVVVSPGVPVTDILYAKAITKGIETIGELELGLRCIKNRCVGITGTNGKTTVTLLTEHVLNYAKINAIAVGNVGKPLTSYLLDGPQSEDVLIIELSSFQIETLSAKVFDVAVLLNITPDHLDRYLSMEDYAKQKVLLSRCLKKKKPFYVNEKCFQNFQRIFEGVDYKLFGTSPAASLKTDLESVYLNENIEYKLPCSLRGFYTHEVENLMAAYAIAKEFGLSPEQFLEAFATFKKPPHRIEFVREVNLIKYYDDSKGTNIDAVIQAVTSIQTPLYLIAGGVDKGSSYEPWKRVFNNKVKGVFAIGQAARKISTDLAPEIDVKIVETLQEAVIKATEMATPGSSILLSPGCSSFDMFKDYKERGNAFKKIVNLL
jgi:UDP-N-acetylmuramoylalanine--D-glutamate ligase